MKTVPIDGNSNYHRDINTHAVINTNNAEYETYMRQKRIIQTAKDSATKNEEVIDTMSKDIEKLKKIVAQLINKDSNVTSITTK